MWEGGAASFGRVDEWSDIDVQFAVDDERVADAVLLLEETLEDLGGIETRLVLPQPTSHGHWQGFYRLKRASKFLLVDLVVMKKSSTNRFSQPEIHGQPRISYDKIGFLKTDPLNKKELMEKLENRVRILATTFDLFQPFVLKELNRRNYAEAFAYYNSVTVRPLIELLRVKYCPARHDFYTRYLYYDLPRNVAERLESFYFVSGPEELGKKHGEAVEWFNRTFSELTVDTPLVPPYDED